MSSGPNNVMDEGPAAFLGSGGSPRSRYSNPFYGVPFQFLPQNVDHMMWWANHFLFRFPFYKTALSRIANYFITELSIECDDSDAKEKYEEIFEDLSWKRELSKTGLNLLAYGNECASITQGFDRFLICPVCKRITNIEKIDNYTFSTKGDFSCKCKGCGNTGIHESVDKPSKDLKRIQIVHWPVRQIKVRYDLGSQSSEYYWDIPKEYVTQVTQPNNKFFSKKTPKAIFDAIYKGKMLAFNDKNFIHLKLPTPVGIPSEGKAIPLCIYMFDDFFMLKVLERFNQAIMFEDIVPFRVFSMAQQGSGNVQVNPVLNQSAPQWLAGIKNMIQDHRQDPGSYGIFPFQFQYEHLGADGKQLAPTELIQNTISNILNALNIPQELYSMSLQVQAMGPSLRLFENSWSFLIDIYNELLGKVADVISKINGLPKAKIKLMDVTMSDDMERKSIIAQLVASNSISRSELLKLYSFDYKDQVRKKFEEDAIMQEMQQEQQEKQQLQSMMDSGFSISDGSGQQQPGGGGGTPQDVLDQAQQIAQKLFPLDGAGRRDQLQQIKATNQTLYSAVKQQLEEMTKGAKSQGVQQAKQQSQGPGAQ